MQQMTIQKHKGGVRPRQVYMTDLEFKELEDEAKKLEAILKRKVTISKVIRMRLFRGKNEEQVEEGKEDY